MKLHLRLIPLVSAVCLEAGCVAFNVGEPEVFTHVENLVETAASPKEIEIRDVRVESKPDAGKTGMLDLTFSAEISETLDRIAFTRTYRIRKQKRLSFGFFPAVAEYHLMPDGALQACCMERMEGWNALADDEGIDQRFYNVYFPEYSSSDEWMAVTLLPPFCVLWLGGTLNALFYELPFANWECTHDLYDPDAAEVRTETIVHFTGKKEKRTFRAAGASKKLQSVQHFPGEDLAKMGFSTCFNIGRGEDGNRPGVSHFSLFGFHKYLAVFVDDPEDGPVEKVGTDVRTKTIPLPGAFVAELSIPSLGYSDRRRIPSGDSGASFSLPAVGKYCQVAAIVKLKSEAAGGGSAQFTPECRGLAWPRLREWRLQVTLYPEDGKKMATGEPVLNPLYEIASVSRTNGGFRVTVNLADASQKKRIEKFVRLDVESFIRTDYLARNPGLDAREIVIRIAPETREKARRLVYTGWAISVKPVEEGFSYDHSTRRGLVRLRIAGDMPTAEMRRWARENIAAVVENENVVLEQDKAPPPGAQYRSLSETFENGVLAVEFEAIK